jgi:hypothetical protein
MRADILELCLYYPPSRFSKTLASPEKTKSRAVDQIAKRSWRAGYRVSVGDTESLKHKNARNQSICYT